MRASSLLVAGLAPLAVLATLAMPAIAQLPAGAGTGASPAEAVPLDLEAIPIRPVTGRRVVRGVTIDDEEDDHPYADRHAEHRLRAELDTDDDDSGESDQ